MATPLKLQLEILATGGNRTVGELQRVREGVQQVSVAEAKGSQQAGVGLGGQLAQLSALSFAYNNVVGALRNLQATAAPVYESLIAGNEKLNAQILSSQTNLASATRIFRGGIEIVDPTEKIEASQGRLRAAIKQIEIDTQSLVGVTSAQVNELFQITLTNAGALNNQSKQFPDAISAATQLTKGWAASLKVVGIPLQQARQEINSILKGQVTQDSILAKNLNVTNQQVEQWRAQRVLVDELNKKLDVFVAGNAIAARSIEGIASNLQDLSERIARNAGELFLAPLIDTLAEAEKFLKANEVAISALFGQLTGEILAAGSSVAEAFAPAGKTLLEIGADIGPIALSAIEGLLNTFVGLSKVIGPLANTLFQAANVLTDFAATDLGGIVVQTTAVVLVLGQLTTIIAGLSAAALPALWGAAIATATSMGTLYTSVIAVTTGNTAMALSIPALQTALSALTAQAISLNAALIPLTAALALAFLVRKTKELEDENEAMEIYGQQIARNADGVGFFAKELNEFNRIRKNGGALTAEQIAKEQRLIANAAALAESIEDQIKGQKKLTGLSSDGIAQRDNNIKALEAQRVALDKATGGIKLEANLLQDLGTTAELAEEKLKNFNRQIQSEGGGDKGAFEAALKGKIGLIQSEIGAKRMSIEVARAELEAVKSNTKAELEVRNQAKEAIDKLYDGRIAKIKELIETSELAANAGLEELGKIKGDEALEPATRRKAAQQIIAIRKEQIAAETAAITTGKAEIELLQAQQRLGEAAGEKELSRIKLDEIGKRIEANKVGQENTTGEIEKAKLIEEEKQLGIELDKVRADSAAKDRKRAVENFDERRNLIKSQNDLGAVDRAEYNQRILINDLQQNDLQIKQQREALRLLSATDREGREAINAQIAQSQSKRVEIWKAYDRAEIERSNQFYEQELTIFTAAKDARLLSEAAFADLRARNRIEQADREIEIQKSALTRLGAADIDGRNEINAKINALESKKIAALDQLYQSQLERIKIAQDKASQEIQASQVERGIISQRLANQQLTAAEELDRQKLESTRQSLIQQLALAEIQERELAKLAIATRSPEAERAYQKEVAAARLNTARTTMSLLENEAQGIERVRNLAIKAIEDEQAARSRTIDTQLSRIESIKNARSIATQQAELGANREVAAIELVSKALDRQNSLQQAKIGLTKAIADSNSTGQQIEIDKTKRAIELTKQLEQGNLNPKEQITIQQQIASLVGSNGRSIYDLTRRQQELEREMARDKRENLIAEQAQAQNQLTLDLAKNDLAIRRQVIESQIAELKAKQGLLDAQALRDQDRLNTAKAVGAAQEAVDKAEKIAPGRERDRQVADAKNRLQTATNAGANSARNAEQGVTLAAQQVDFAKQNVAAVLEQQKQQSQINDLQKQTLDIQQKTALSQLDAADGAKRQADELTRARAEGELLLRAQNGIGANAPGKFNIRSTGIDRSQIRDLSVPPPTPVPQSSAPVGGGNKEVVDEIRGLRSAIESRNPQIVNNVAFAAPDTSQFDEYNKLQRSIARASV